MPGLVCVLGRDRAADLARAAARPLLRRPWQTLELAPTRDDVALGFAGECGGVAHDPETGVALAFDGETFGEGGALAGAQAVQELLAGYLAAGADVKLPQGAFAAAVWDPRSESLTLLTDNHGRRNFWMAELGGTWLFAGELKALVAAGVEPRLDLETWSQLFAYEGPLPGQCPLEGVSLLGGATTVTIAGGRKEAHTGWRYRLAPETEGDIEEWAEDFAEVLEAAVARRLGDVGLALSGGYDSRCVGSIVRMRAPETPALTYGAPGSNDLRLGTEVAGLLGLPHRAAPFERGYLAHGAAETVWLSEGAIRAFHAHHLYLRPLRTDDDARAVLINYGGDHVTRTVGGALQMGGESVEGDNFHRFRAQTISDELLEDLHAAVRGADPRPGEDVASEAPRRRGGRPSSRRARSLTTRRPGRSGRAPSSSPTSLLLVIPTTTTTWSTGSADARELPGHGRDPEGLPAALPRAGCGQEHARRDPTRPDRPAAQGGRAAHPCAAGVAPTDGRAP
jgi:hypothetical protein